MSKQITDLNKLNNICVEIDTLSSHIYQTYLSNSNSVTYIKNSLYKLFKKNIFIINEKQYLYIKYTFSFNERYNFVIASYLFNHVPKYMLLLTDKQLESLALSKKHISLDKAMDIALNHQHITIDRDTKL